MRDFTSFLAPLINSYIFYQKSFRHWNESSYELNLSLFDKYCKKQYPDALKLSQEMVDAWCRKRETENNNSCQSRIYPVISFIRYLQKRGKTTIMPPDLPRREPTTYIPHAFTNEELTNFFAACDKISDLARNRSRRIIVPVFFRLLYSSGIRTTEARLLRIEDVDLTQGVLNIRYSKGYAEHYVVLHDTMLELLKQYDITIRKQYPNRTYFFPNGKDGFYKRAWVQWNFKKMWSQNNNSHTTAYELRHHYAIENINNWVDEGFGFGAKLCYLSKSMGHSTMESTKQYYSLVPGLADILKTQTEELIPEVNYESL